MIERRIVRRYAAALFAAASKADAVDTVESDLGLVVLTLQSSPELWETITSPIVPSENKRAILEDIFKGKVHEITLLYLGLLVDKRREEAALQTQEEYVLLANEARGIVDAEATTAKPLDESEQAQLVAKLSSMTGKQIRLQCIIDPAVIGGVLVRIGDRVIDGSVKGQLEALREQLLA
jgi:F-type H+-transporting ATPase subunit delta